SAGANESRDLLSALSCVAQWQQVSGVLPAHRVSEAETIQEARASFEERSPGWMAGLLLRSVFHRKGSCGEDTTDDQRRPFSTPKKMTASVRSTGALIATSTGRIRMGIVGLGGVGLSIRTLFERRAPMPAAHEVE